MSGAAPSPFFDFDAQIKGSDAGFAASDDNAFAFRPLEREFQKFELFECSTHFFVFGSGRDRAGKASYSLLEIHREECRIEENSAVCAPSLANHARYASCRGIIAGAASGNRWPVRVQLKGGGSEVVFVEAAALVADGALKWCTQQLPDEFTVVVLQKELAARHKEGWLQHEKFDGIVGFARFTEGWYFIGACKKEVAAKVCSCEIYRNGSTLMIPFTAYKEPSEVEKRYRSLFKTIVEKQDTRGFYFSYDYDVSRTLQSNMGAMPQPIIPAGKQYSIMNTFDEKFIWNLHLLRDIPEALHPWCVVLIQGFVEQHRVIIGYNRIVSIALVARRSRHFAGTRYNKRGQDMQGHCANEVEVEQIVSDESQGTSLGGHCHTSFVQLRASIPLFWSQPTAGLNPKPAVCLHNMDPLYHVTALHLSQLLRRYGSPVYILNLVKRQEKKKRESLLSEEFEKAVQILNAGITDKQHIFRYIHFDFFQESKSNREIDTVYDRLLKLTTQIVDDVGIFHAGSNRWASPSANGVPVNKCMQQRGVLRSNCIDCLDRTNAAQFWAGVRALTLQFQALGLTNTDLPSSCNIIEDLLMDMYVKLGDELAIQYVGSLAHDKTGGKANKSAGAGGLRKVTKLIVSAQRYISNTFTDQEKQQAFDVFLGTFCPRLNQFMAPVIWQSEDRSFSWSSNLNNEFCPLRPNRPTDCWWRQPLQCFSIGTQMGYTNITVAASSLQRSSAMSVIAEPFKAVIHGRRTANSSILSMSHFEERPMGFTALADVQSDSLKISPEDDYSLEGWGFETSSHDDQHESTSFSNFESAVAQHVTSIPRPSPAVTADFSSSSNIRAHSDTISTYKDTPNFRQLRESINYELSHDWKKLICADGLVSDAEDGGPSLPRMRTDAPSAIGDGRRKIVNISQLFSQSQPSILNGVTLAKSTLRNSLSLARVNVLDDLNDIEIRDWAGGNDPFVLNIATEDDLIQSENGAGPVNFLVLEHSRLPDHAFRGIQLINFSTKKVPLELDRSPNESIIQSSFWNPVTLYDTLHSDKLMKEIGQLTKVSPDWEMLGHATKADVGISVDVDEEQGDIRVIVMSAKFQLENASSSLQRGDEIKSINGLRIDQLVQSCQSKMCKAFQADKCMAICAEVKNLLLGCAGSPVRVYAAFFSESLSKFWSEFFEML